jgi:ADP-heptose:LPS heptosyltransferase
MTRLLIYRMGSLGDTVVALPVFHLIERAFPDSERRILTNFPVNSDAAPLQAVLGDTGFAAGYFAYPIGTRSPQRLLSLRQEIRNWQPDAAIYLTARDGLSVRRDLLFLRSCGVPEILCAPTSRDLQTHRAQGSYDLWEPEAARLARCCSELGDADITNPASWSLRPTAAETERADALLSPWSGADHFVAFSIGAKIDIKSWGDNRWAAVLKGLSDTHPDLGIALIGGPNDRERSDAVVRDWRGPVLNLCGAASPRVSAMIMDRAKIFMGHDSGPMHLAASVGTPSVSVFSNRAKPGIWFPFGAQNRVFYPGLAWSGGAPPVFRDAAGEANMMLVPNAPVLDACLSLLHSQLTVAPGMSRAVNGS